MIDENELTPETFYHTILTTSSLLVINHLFIAIGLFGVWYGTTTNHPTVSLLSSALWLLVLYHNYKLIKTVKNQFEPNNDN